MLVGAGLCLGLLVSGCSQEVDLDPPRPLASSQGERDAGAQQLLERLAADLRSGNAAGLADLGTAAAKPLLSQVGANARKLRLSDLALRYIDDRTAPLDATGLARYGQNAWVGTAELTYRLTGWDRARTHTEIQVVFAPRGEQLRIAGLGGPGERTPLWLTGALVVKKAGRTLVLAKGGANGQRLSRLATRAVQDVNRVLGGWRGPLVVEVPASEAELASALMAQPEQYANIAAVTTTVDGSAVPGSPVHVFINPQVFDDLGPRGAQVVMSHEATHVATGATFADMPTWLLEGFADYVALDHAGIPVRTAAGQILARVRKDGPSTRLPSAADLDPSASGLGATYEEAWLACRYLAQVYGEQRLIAFYDAVDAGRSLPQAFGQVLGTTQHAFVTGWGADVARLAGASG